MLTISTFLASIVIGLVCGYLHVSFVATVSVALFLGAGAIWEQRDLMARSQNEIIGGASNAQRLFHWAGTYFACFSMSFTLLALTYGTTSALHHISS